ncbi:MAG: hypothetical protein FJY48_12490 [Betaproteobacteria bacterium]|nr:hypothetical protein [Betaproteobacteria bacterium]
MIQPSEIVPQWRTVESKTLGRPIQVKRPSVADAAIPIERSWIRLVRDGDGTPLLAPSVDPTTVEARVVEEIVRLAMEAPNPTPAPESLG